MEVYATAKSVRISPRKVRLVVDVVRNLPLNDALHSLEVMPKRAAKEVAKTLKSAVANATHNAKLDPENLVIGSIMVSEGQVLKRFRPSTRGRIHPYKKRSSNIRIMVTEKAGSNRLGKDEAQVSVVKAESGQKEKEVKKSLLPKLPKLRKDKKGDNK